MITEKEKVNCMIKGIMDRLPKKFTGLDVSSELMQVYSKHIDHHVITEHLLYRLDIMQVEGKEGQRQFTVC